ncbi:MAG: PGRS family protein [Polyangiaceae bacterium]
MIVAALSASTGCTNFYEEYYQPLVGTGGTGGTGGTTTTSIQPECIPTNAVGPIDDSCGVFVSASGGLDSNDGTSKSKAVSTLTKALAIAKGRPIYACADAGKPFSEAIEIDGEVQIFGGLDCATWEYTPQTKTLWSAPADQTPLHVKKDASVTVQSFAITAADSEKEGGSSIAIIAEVSASLDLKACDVTAGDGKVGETPATPAGMGTPGVMGGDGAMGCEMNTPASNAGAVGGLLTCAGTVADGGPGGAGIASSTGAPGGPGQPDDGVNGLAGNGQKDSPATACTAGGDGADGLPGDPGAGATGNGAVSNSGFTGVPGADGVSVGKPGQGGGGGGGASKCSSVNAGKAGPSAGGGGSGGCGGSPGKGGSSGGASIAILSLGATLTFLDTKVTAGNGGNGGDGGLGQPGGEGGKAGMPGDNNGDASAAACGGGKGGKGGPGGRGGGGRGGHSIGIAYTGKVPDVTNITKIVTGTPGEGGAGDGAMGKGAAGIPAETQAF